MLFLQKPRTVVVLITYIISIVSSRAVVENRPASFSKRTFTFDGACDAHPEISRGVSDATTLATHAISTLQNPNPSINKQTWQDLRTALFGSETLSPTASIVAMYDNIASNPDVKVWCGEPVPTNKNADCASSCAAWGFDAFESNVVPGTESGDEQVACGYTAGHNIVVCPVALPGGTRGFGNLADAEPTPGSSLECFKQTWAAMFVHELSHTFGAFDFGSPYGYGFVGATKIATDAGRSGSGKGTNGATPMSNADTWSLFSLGVYSSTNPFVAPEEQFASFEWSTGSAVSIVIDEL